MKIQWKICVTFLLAVCCLSEKQLWNDKTDILLNYFSIGYKSSNSTDIPIMDIVNGTFDNSTVNVSGIALGDITTIKRLSDVILETKPNGDTRISGTFGLEKFELKITSVRMDNYSGPAIVTSKDNSAGIAYTIKSPEKIHSCTTKWEHFILGNFSNITILTPSNFYQTPINTTEEFNKRILPALNIYFNSHEFLDKLSKTFDFCTLKKYLFPL